MNRGMILPVAALLVVAGCVGLLLGLRKVSPTESEIIARHAEAYEAETGGEEIDCYGVPTAVDGVRLMVICEREGAEPWYVAVDEQGMPVAEDVLLDRPGT